MEKNILQLQVETISDLCPTGNAGKSKMDQCQFRRNPRNKLVCFIDGKIGFRNNDIRSRSETNCALRRTFHCLPDRSICNNPGYRGESEGTDKNICLCSDSQMLLKVISLELDQLWFRMLAEKCPWFGCRTVASPATNRQPWRDQICQISQAHPKQQL